MKQNYQVITHIKMKNTSVAGVGMYSFMLVSLLNMLNIEITQSDAEPIVLAVLTVISFLTWVYGQVRRTDLDFGLFRK